MTNHNPEPRFDGRPDRISIGGRLLPLETGVFPEDFPERLNRLKEASGLTWSAFAQVVGVDDKQLRRWRNEGVEPSGGPLMALVRFALRIPGGLEILSGEDVPPPDPEPVPEEDEDGEGGRRLDPDP